MGLRDVLFGKKKLAGPARERLFALTTAAVTLDTELGLRTAGDAGIVFKPLSAGEFVRAENDLQQLLDGVAGESGSGLPPGAFQLPNDARATRYVGAAPPEGTGRHRYIFAALAVDAERIEIDKEATPAWLMYQIFGCTLGRAFLEGWYER